MASQESSVRISQFTSTAESAPDDVAREESSIWADDAYLSDTPAISHPVPEAMRHLVKKGMAFQQVYFWGIHEEQPRLVRNQSIYFSVDTIVTSQTIIEAFDRAGIEVGEIVGIQRKASNNSWVVTFDSSVT